MICSITPRCLLASLILCFCNTVWGNLTVSTNQFSLQVNTCSPVQFILSSPLVPENATVSFHSQHSDVARIATPEVKLVPKVSQQVINVSLCSYHLGHTVVFAKVTPNFTSYHAAFMHVAVYNYASLDVISFICGWTYFFFWSISFYPQAISNYRRKSVVGLNFDFLTLNIIGYILYSIFNCGLYWFPSIQKDYFARYPRSLNPVQLNDVGFSVHAAILTTVTIIQCFIYERGEQAVSKTAMGIITVYGIILASSSALVFMRKILLLDLLYICSYIKLCITLIKYIPQALMNYRRKSTVGWSIGNVICDFCGGMLSIFQMLINSYNYDDWLSIFGDVTKFGLGLFSVAFDILFLLQHYVFYRQGRREGSRNVANGEHK